MSNENNLKPETDHHDNVVRKPRQSAMDTEFTEREVELLLAEVQQAVYDLFVKIRRLWCDPVTFDDIEDAYCARDQKNRLGYPDNLVDAVQSWIVENTNAENERDRLFFVDVKSEEVDGWHINEHVIPDDIRERRKERRLVPPDPKPRRSLRTGQEIKVFKSTRYPR